MTDTDYKKRCEDYEKILGVGEVSIEKSAFFALCKMVESQTHRLNKFNLETEIGKDAKEDKIYDRTMGIVKEFPKLLTEVSALRKELGIERKDMSSKSRERITPESISNVLGNTTGQQD